MKTSFTLLFILVFALPQSIKSQNYPSIGAYTVMPAFYGPVIVPTKFVTATTILNQGQHLGTSFTITPPGPGGLGKIELRGCYYDGQLLPATQTFIDTFYVGMLQGGDSYTVTFRAYLSSSSASCVPVDSNQISFFHTIPIVESLQEWSENEKLLTYPNPAKNEFILETSGQIGQVLQIRDVEGRLQKEMVIEETQTRLQLNTLKAGVYFYSILKGQNSIVYSGKILLSP
ncbi:MAG: T9SS type A sorting domain-containing protein [Bacteroidia bacterium]|nr:T9SS type A sorting domain-containing protein [Bacteroidia bacterium]